MRFTDAHSASAVCTPTRYGLLTGRDPWRIGQFGVLTTYSAPIIPQSRPTIASMLKQQGYATACVGKWHLGLAWQLTGKRPETPPIGTQFDQGPTTLGFDYFCGFTHARNIGAVLEGDRVAQHVAAVEVEPLLDDKAVAWLEQQSADQPFFLYLPICPPHTPVVPSDTFLGKSDAVDVVGNDPKYGDWLYQGDARLGRVCETLDRLQLADNTIVIATSDNGAEHRAYEPLRESKRSIYEGGHRVPLVVRWPGRVKPGTTCHHLVSLNDLMATLAEITDQTLPSAAAEDSVSLAGVLTGDATSPARDYVVTQSMKGDLAIRHHQWKLVLHKSGKRELFDLESDLSETTDLAAREPERAEQMAARLRAFIDRGRSTPGEPQPSEHKLWWPKSPGKPRG
jgi:arylsulfatase A-like enzyme